MGSYNEILRLRLLEGTTSLTRKLKVFVVEDEPLVAMLIEDMLAEMGHEVGAVASRFSEALDIAVTGSFDLAILDVNLGGKHSYPVARVLRERKVPFVFATGYGANGLDKDYADAPILAKPFANGDLERLIAKIFTRDAVTGDRAQR